MQIGPQRIVPISLIGARYPEVIAMLEATLRIRKAARSRGVLWCCHSASPGLPITAA